LTHVNQWSDDTGFPVDLYTEKGMNEQAE